MVRLEDIANMNPWWTKGAKFIHEDRDLIRTHKNSFFFERKVPELKPENIYIIKGPRRVGKTVWMKKLIMQLIDGGINQLDIFYYSLDNVRSKNELQNMLLNFISNTHMGIRYILLDEIQSVEGWESVIQGMVNSGYTTNTVIILTGSVAHLFRNEMMPGRGTEGNTYIMRNIGFNEFCTKFFSDVKNIKFGVNRVNSFLGYNFTNDEMASLLKLLEEKTVNLEEDMDQIYKIMSEVGVYAIPLKKMFEIYMRTGGYPASINSYLNINPGKPQFKIDPNVYEEIYLYAKNDGARIAGIKTSGDPIKAASVMSSILMHIGTRMSYSKLAGVVDMNTKTFIDYLHRLEESYTFINITGKDGALQNVRMQKIYFTDILMHYSIGAETSGINPSEYTEKLILSNNIGAIIEEIVLEHLIKLKESYPMKQYGTYINFLAGKNNKEIDFTFRRENGSYVAIEVKYQNSIDTREVYRIDAISDYLILTKNILKRDGNTLSVPTYLMLALFGKSKHNL